LTVALVGAGPGDPRLITVRGLELVRRCHVLVYDRLVAEELVAYGAEGYTVVRLKGGDPFVFGRGGEEALALAEAEVPFEIVPGVSSLSSVPGAAGIPVTHRGLCGSVTAVAAHEPARLDFAALARVGGTLVFFMGLARVAELADGLVRQGLDPTTPAAVVASGTTDAQESVTATLADLPAATDGIEPPALVVVGETVALAAALRPSRSAARALRRRRLRSRPAVGAPLRARAS
jgi:siroheme synthase